MAATDGPSTLSVVVGTAIISLLTGYMLGTASSLGFLPSPFGAKSPVAPIIRAGRDTSHYDDEEESSEEEIDDPTVLNHAPNWANSEKADKRDGLRNSALQQQAKRGAEGKEQKVPEGWDLSEESKLVLVVRTDLGMTKGMLHLLPSTAAMLIQSRQNRRTMRPRYARLLQDLAKDRQPSTQALGAPRAGQGRAAGQE
jgi:PTH2 family peptidyl-tRNA hydrolase